TPTEPGWYRVYSWIETRPGLDMIAENNAQEKYYYFVNLLPAQVTHNTNQSTQGNHGMSTAFELIGARPNPFNNTTNISWQIPVSALVKLTVYDATGRTIKTLENNSYPAGNYNTTWNRTDDANQRVAAGIYFYEIKANNYTARQKLVIK
ncbi:MAG: T9SS type A sorting domain-containing protein, partial [Candidatus Latescibacteria bacterium]|nr:T9SS type A sorting domain-containing protein [Candidatus Latescibacterota bacterium]